MAVAQKLCIIDPMLVMPKCALGAVVFFFFLKNCKQTAEKCKQMFENCKELPLLKHI